MPTFLTLTMFCPQGDQEVEDLEKQLEVQLSIIEASKVVRRTGSLLGSP